ncbi:Thioredoxin reductase [Candidatus Magnetomoraceae bacterium gMMP-15]
MYDLIIVGGGPGGLTAGIYAMRAALKTVLFEKGIFGGQVAISDEVENYPGFEEISGFDLSQKFFNHAKKFDLEIEQKEVVSIKPKDDFYEVHLSDETSLKSYAVILGAGGYNRKLNIPGEKELYGKGVSYCATCDGFFFRNKIVSVIGGGDSAVEEAIYLAKITKKVYLLHRRDELRASRILQERAMNDPKIEILWNTIPTKINSNEQGVCGLSLKNTKTDDERELETDGVFIFIGYLPNNELVPAGVKMNQDGYVITDEKCETNIPGFYVIGDLREKFARQIVLAAADGCNAALAASHYVETKN